MGAKSDEQHNRWPAIARKHYDFAVGFALELAPTTPQAELDDVVRIGGGAGIVAVALATDENFRRILTEADNNSQLSLPTEHVRQVASPEDIVYAAWIVANAAMRDVSYEIPPTAQVIVAPGTEPALEEARYRDIAQGS